MTASEKAGKFLSGKGVKVAAVVDPFFGDNGKGKIVDLFGEWADMTIRGTGGANAGHTIVIGGNTYVFHLLPSSISRDGEGKVSVIGRGTVVNPGSLAVELAALDAANLTHEHLRISADAQLVLPTHLILDHLAEAMAGAGKIGTTKQGVGPAYSAHRARLGVRVNDLLNPDALAADIKKSVEDAKLRLTGAGREAAHTPVAAVEGGAFWDEKDFIHTDAVIAWVKEKSAAFTEKIADTDAGGPGPRAAGA
jgi:adenylosuccinate synthase